MATPNTPDQKSPSRGTAQLYTSSLFFDKHGQSQLASLTVASCNPGGLGKQSTNTSIDEPTTQGAEVAQKIHSIPDVMSCSCCRVTFTDREEQISHFKCDWHRYNLHQRLRGHQVISEERFDQLANDSDVSSISGSDESEEEDTEEESRILTTPVGDQPFVDPSALQNLPSERKFHKVFFKNHNGELISLHRCLLHHKKSPITEAEEIVKAAMELPNKTKWVILMISSGHFAGAVFQGREVIAHKTFHRYTVRQKSGTAQSTRDNKGNAPKSAGSHLRRYNEAALNQEVTELLNGWSSHINECDFIFVRIPVNNRGIFYGGKNPILKKDDQRVRVIPFPTRRPTFNEIRRVQQVLASVESYGQESEMGDIIPYSPPRVFVPETGELELREPKPEKKGKNKSPKRQEKASEPDGTEKSLTDNIEETKQGQEEGETSVDMDLVEMVQTIDLSHLKEFGNSPVPKKNKKKKNKDNSAKSKTSSGPDTMDEDRIRWQNKLFTACKTGDLDTLQRVVEEIRNTRKSPVPSNSGSTSVSSFSNEPNCSNPNEAPLKNAKGEGLNDGIPVAEASCPSSEASLDKSSNQEKTTTNGSELQVKSSDPPIAQQCPGQSTGPIDSSVDLLIQVLNKPIGDSGATLLHLSAKHGHPDIVMALMESGADPALKDKSGKTPYGLGEMEVRNSMRRFMAINPEKYDYAKAQVPSPLTAEMEAERKQKNAEKRKMKKKAFNEKNKEKKAEQAKLREENAEKERFLKLSDREKRALAAERRLLQQQTEQGGAKPVLSRCWQCGTDITGQVPFEYSDYKFCTTKCLREHRAAKPSS